MSAKIAFHLPLNSYTPFHAGVSLGAVVLAISVSSGIGVIFGVIPAQRAAHLDPIMALRKL